MAPTVRQMAEACQASEHAGRGHEQDAERRHLAAFAAGTMPKAGQVVASAGKHLIDAMAAAVLGQEPALSALTVVRLHARVRRSGLSGLLVAAAGAFSNMAFAVCRDADVAGQGARCGDAECDRFAGCSVCAAVSTAGCLAPASLLLDGGMPGVVLRGCLAATVSQVSPEEN